MSIDLNADLGEGFPYDESLLGLITSANIACGFHAGDLDLMRQICGWCADRGVAVGAQVSYRDREGFGRRDVEIGYGDLLADLVEQREALSELAIEAGTSVRYLKPHGALYNRSFWDPVHAAAVVRAADGLPVLGLPRSLLLDVAASAGTRGVPEFFADRGYTREGTLVPRTQQGALVTDPHLVAERVVRLVVAGTVLAVDGSPVTVAAETICVHGDTDGALVLAQCGTRGTRGTLDRRTRVRMRAP